MLSHLKKICNITATCHNPKDPWFLSIKKINWKLFEEGNPPKSFSFHYSWCHLAAIFCQRYKYYWNMFCRGSNWGHLLTNYLEIRRALSGEEFQNSVSFWCHLVWPNISTNQYGWNKLCRNISTKSSWFRLVERCLQSSDWYILFFMWNWFLKTNGHVFDISNRLWKSNRNVT